MLNRIESTSSMLHDRMMTILSDMARLCFAIGYGGIHVEAV